MHIFSILRLCLLESTFKQMPWPKSAVMRSKTVHCALKTQDWSKRRAWNKLSQTCPQLRVLILGHIWWTMLKLYFQSCWCWKVCRWATSSCLLLFGCGVQHLSDKIICPAHLAQSPRLAGTQSATTQCLLQPRKHTPWNPFRSLLLSGEDEIDLTSGRFR